MNSELIKTIQLALQARGYRVLADGALTDETLTAVAQALDSGKGKRLAWGQKVSPQFREGVYWIADQLKWDDTGPSNLMACMAFESAETFSPSILNGAGSGAVGLIQFMPTTAVQLRTTTTQLAAMTPEKQLGYVFRYLEQFSKLRGPGVTLADLYMSILLPSMIGKPNDAVLFSEGAAYRQNSGLDADRDGKVTKLEASAKLYEKLTRGNLPQFVYVE